MCKTVTGIAVLSLFFFLVSSPDAQTACPCDSFTTDINQFVPDDITNKSSVRAQRLQQCLTCREKMGLHYSLCTPWLRNNIDKFQLSVNSKNESAKFLIELADDYKVDCEKSNFVDIDHTMRGEGLLGGGIAMLTGGILINIFTPSILAWGQSYSESSDWLIDIFAGLFKALISVIVAILGVAFDAGGTTCITIGAVKMYQYDNVQLELPRFQDDMYKLGISIQY